MPMTRRDALARLAGLIAMSAAPARTLAAAASSDPLAGTIAAYLAGLEAGDWTATEIARLALERCGTDGTAWRAIDVLDPDVALAAARAADGRRRNGERLGPLDGVPVFAKSIYDMQGLPTTASSAEWARLFPDPVARDAVEVARLRAGGAIVLGKTAADDFAYRGNGTSSHTGQVLNPYDPTGTRTPGGSSAGSAVAVAAGMAFAALGTDDGGSNRIPAQFTGVVGMKPTFGLVPRTGVIPTWPYLDTHGPLARTVADAAALLAVIAGADASDPLALAGDWNPVALRDDALDGVRLGLVEAHVPREGMTGEAVAAWERAVADWRSLRSDADAQYDDVVRFDAADIEPVVTWGITPSQSTSIGSTIPTLDDVKEDERASVEEAYAYMSFAPGQKIAGTKIDVAFVGSCTNGRMSDFESIVRLIRGKGYKVKPHVKALVVPGSQALRRQMVDKGYDKVFTDAGFEFREAGCSMCLAMNPDKLSGNEVCASSSNRNFKGRQGSPTGRTLLMSPVMVAASAIAGQVTDARELFGDR